jgi:hypothetical protein
MRKLLLPLLLPLHLLLHPLLHLLLHPLLHPLLLLLPQRHQWNKSAPLLQSRLTTLGHHSLETLKAHGLTFYSTGSSVSKSHCSDGNQLLTTKVTQSGIQAKLVTPHT